MVYLHDSINFVTKPLAPTSREMDTKESNCRYQVKVFHCIFPVFPRVLQNQLTTLQKQQIICIVWVIADNVAISLYNICFAYKKSL